MNKIWFRCGLLVLTFFIGVSSNAVWTTRNNVPSEFRLEAHTEKGEFADLFYDLRTDEIPKRNRAVSQILEIGNQSAEYRSRIVGAMMKEISSLRLARHISPADADEMQVMSFILADWQAVEALDVLIDCSHQKSGLYTDGLSYDDFPLYAGILRFGKSAIPTLERRLNDGETSLETKHLIINALREIDHSRAERILAEARQKIMKMPASEYFKKCKKLLESRNTPDDIKINIADELVVIGGKKARQVLNEAAKKQTDENTANYLQKRVLEIY